MNKLGKGEAGYFSVDFVRCSEIYQIDPNFNLNYLVAKQPHVDYFLQDFGF